MSKKDNKKIQIKSLFLSDVHLGFRGCQAEILLDLLKAYEYENLFLVGDIIDLWAMKSKMFFPVSHSNVIRHILKQAKKDDVRVVFIPGNHDELFRDYCGETLAGVEIHEEFLYESVSGKRFLLLHGDKFDLITLNNRWLALFGSWLYDVSLSISSKISFFRRKLGFKNHWSFSRFMKYRVKRAVQYIDNFSDAVGMEAKARCVEGIIAGHIHHPEISMLPSGVHYMNCGDFVESCSAIVEQTNGSFHLVSFPFQKV
jgi:UDP-2,3-diacylglucosamine pyrophosphatase LpxH